MTSRIAFLLSLYVLLSKVGSDPAYPMVAPFIYIPVVQSACRDQGDDTARYREVASDQSWGQGQH